MPSKMQQRALLASALATVAAAIRLLRRRGLHTPPKPLPSDYPVAPADIVAAHARVKPHVHRTPVLTCQGLDALAGRSLKFKCEVFQKTGSFKIAYYFVCSCICSSRCIDALSLATVAPSSASRPHRSGLKAGRQRT